MVSLPPDVFHLRLAELAGGEGPRLGEGRRCRRGLGRPFRYGDIVDVENLTIGAVEMAECELKKFSLDDTVTRVKAEIKRD